MAATRRRRPAKLARASAYYRLAAKADKAAQYRDGDRYRGMADRLVVEHRAEAESRARRAAAASGLRPRAST